jgi:chaperonin cofactor prefoldin
VDTATISALVLLVSTIGGALAWRKVGAERTAIVVGYQTDIIEDLKADNDRLHMENARLERQNEQLRIRVHSLENRLTNLERRLS